MFSKISNIGKLIHFATPSTFFRIPKQTFGTPKNSPKYKMKREGNFEELNKKSREYSNLQIGLYGFIFACCFAAIPLYRVFCEHVGLVGNYDKKTYEFKQQSIVNVKKYSVKFQGLAQTGINWEFEPVEKQVTIGASQTAIVFYRLRNKQNRPIVGFSTYNIHPQQVNLYFSKIQCFCFNQQMVNPEEQLLLPIFFYLQPEINDDPDVSRIQQIKVNYQFYQSNNQDLAKFAAEQVRKIEENKRKLNQIRAKKSNMTIEQYQQRMDEQQDLQRREIAEIKIEGRDPTMKQIHNKKILQQTSQGSEPRLVSN